MSGLLESDDFSNWVGRSIKSVDLLTERLASGLAAVLNAQNIDFKRGDAAPAGIHWCLAPKISRSIDLKADGHPRDTGIFPPIPLPHRMFAASEAEFFHPLWGGDEVSRVSTLTQVTPKQGKSGPLCFVTVKHEYSTSLGLHLRETQDIVFRDVSRAVPPTATNDETAPGEAIAKKQMVFDLTVLFRYSALTFNSHRIHFDRRYATGVERLSGLIVHSPLLATCLIDFAASLKASPPSHFTFRSTRPLEEMEAVTLYARERTDGLDLEAAGETIGRCMTATAKWVL